MSKKTEGVLEIAAALLVLFSAMVDPRVSMIIAVLALVGFGIYSFIKK